MTQREFHGGGLISPYDLKDEDGYRWLKGNLHSHTTNSDGAVSPQERLDGYVEEGYDFLCLSDHHNITPVDSVKVPDPFLLIQGAELHPDNPFGGQMHHFLGLNLADDIPARQMPPQHVIEVVQEQGGSVWLAHPHWSAVKILRDTLPLVGLSGIEVFNSTCRSHGRGESSVHWDDWMELENRLYPCIATDDAHASSETGRDTYESWTMVRVKERTIDAVMEALATGASYGTTGPAIHHIGLEQVDTTDKGDAIVGATVRCSPAVRVAAIQDVWGVEYRNGGKPFEEATLRLRPRTRWVRFEVVGADGCKAWSNPFDLTVYQNQ